MPVGTHEVWFSIFVCLSVCVCWLDGSRSFITECFYTRSTYDILAAAIPPSELTIFERRIEVVNSVQNQTDYVSFKY